MRKLSTLLFLALLSFTTWAYDFQVGQLCYDISVIPNKVYVTYQQYPYPNGSAYPSLSGDISIPSIVTYNGTVYTVIGLGYATFYGCTSLSSVTIPNSVTGIGEEAFNNCSSLTNIHVESGNPSYSSENGVLFNADKTTLVQYPAGKTETAYNVPVSVTNIEYDAFRYCFSLTTVTIPEGVTSIGSSAFENCSSLTTVTIPESVTSIGSSAFENCSSLFSFTIPTNVTSITANTFSGCTSLSSISIPVGVASIGSSAFKNCTSLTSVTIPTSVTSIGYEAFWGCSSLASVYYTGSIAEWCAIDFDYEANPVYYAHNLYINGNLLTELIIPDGVIEIKDYAFAGSSFTFITIPTSVTSIGVAAFKECSSLISVTIPEGLTSIVGSVFRDCISLTSVTIPTSVTSIDYGAFWGCSSLASVNIPTGVTSIGRYAFEGTALYNNTSNWNNNVLYIDNCLIKAKSELSGAFNIETGTRVIGDWAFYDCISLTSVTIPNSVTIIGYSVFKDCSSLAEITVLATIPPVADTNAFKEVDRDIPLYVPVASIEAYRTADVWKEFTNIFPIEALTHKQLGITIEGNGTIQYGETTLTKDTALYIVPETQTTLQLLPAEGYAITQVLYNGTDYSSNVTADGTVTLPAMTENGILSVQFDVPLYTIAYYVEGSDAYFENDVINGDNFTLRVKPHTGKTIRTVTLNGQDITNQMQEDGTIELIAIDQDMILIVTCTTTGEPTDFTTQTSYHLRAWQANGTIFAEVDDNVAILQLYDVSGRLMNEHRHNGNYQVITLPAPNEVNILKVVGKDGSITAHKLM